MWHFFFLCLFHDLDFSSLFLSLFSSLLCQAGQCHLHAFFRKSQDVHIILGVYSVSLGFQIQTKLYTGPSDRYYGISV